MPTSKSKTGENNERPIWEKEDYLFRKELDNLAQEFPHLQRRSIHLAFELVQSLTTSRASRTVEHSVRRILRSFAAR